jgi:hypothetical protein
VTSRSAPPCRQARGAGSEARIFCSSDSERACCACVMVGARRRVEKVGIRYMTTTGSLSWRQVPGSDRSSVGHNVPDDTPVRAWKIMLF